MYTPDRQINPDSFYDTYVEETCTCQYCDHQYNVDELHKVRNGKFFEYVCDGCIEESKNPNN